MQAETSLTEKTSAREPDDGEVILGEGTWRYRMLDEWAKLPEGWSFHDVCSIVVDSKDRVHVFCRGAHPIIVFDRDGNMLFHWGEGMFRRPHSAVLGPDEALYCVDDQGNTLRKCTLEGKVLMTIGTGEAAPYMSGRPFNMPTDVALAPNGDIYISDGYGNACIHKYSPDGRHLTTWGRSGIGPGEFNVPHNIVCDKDGWLYVADRESLRVQVFDPNGRFETQWALHRPCGLRQTANDGPFLVTGLGPAMSVNRNAPNLGPRLQVVSKKGEVIANLGDKPAGHGHDRFVAPHGIAFDARGDLYVGEVSHTYWPVLFPDTPIPAGLRSLRKLVKLS